MKVHTFRNLLTAAALALLIPVASAQFDDVYYDPDKDYQDYSNSGNSRDDDYSSDDDVTYYDNEEYTYYDDYDYYYTSRIKRFYTPYSGFGFYDPCYVSYNYYDPYYADAYYYPGSSIYISFGNSNYWNYRHWRNWNRYNRWNHHHGWNNWCLTPSSYYYSYNSWYSPGYNYWGGGYHGYHSYNNYYNTYYNSCPSPVSNYYGITNSTITNINNGSTRGSYYGPRITGNTGSSPRGPAGKPESVQPVLTGSPVPSSTNDAPSGLGLGPRDGHNIPVVPVDEQSEIGKTPTRTPSARTNPSEGLSGIPVDRELDKEKVVPGSKRPVFRPYPSNDESTPVNPSPAGRTAADKSDDQPGPSKEINAPRPRNDRPEGTPSRDNQYQPSNDRSSERPVYTPPSRPSDSQREDKPTYTPRPDTRPDYNPPARSNEQNKAEERPRYSPPPRNNDSDRSNDRPSYNPPSRNESSSGSNRSYSPPPSRNDAPARSGNSNSSGSRSSSSPRSSGRG